MMKWNVKTKVYPDGSTNTIFCNQRIFNDSPTVVKPKKEDEKKSYNNSLKNKKREIITVGTKGYEDEVRSDSLKRARDKIQDIALCNTFEYFVTFTFNPKKVDSFDVEKVKTSIKSWLNNGVKRKKFKYVLIPEYHKSGRIHMHGLFSGDLKLQDSGKRYNGKIIYNLMDWQDKFGWSTAIPLDSNIAGISYYITKYISKGNDKIFGRFYWSSKNLVREPNIYYGNTIFQDVCQQEYYIQGTTRKIKYESDFKF